MKLTMILQKNCLPIMVIDKINLGVVVNAVCMYFVVVSSHCD